MPVPLCWQTWCVSAATKSSQGAAAEVIWAINGGRREARVKPGAYSLSIAVDVDIRSGRRTVATFRSEK